MVAISPGSVIIHSIVNQTEKTMIHAFGAFYMVKGPAGSFLAVMDDMGNLVRTDLDFLNIALS